MTPRTKKKEDKTPTPSTMNIRNYLTHRDNSDKKSDNKISHNKQQKTQDNDILEDNNKEEDIVMKRDNTGHDNTPEDNLPPKKKMTFRTINASPPIKKKIDRFQDFQNGDKCVVGSGRCATHHIKLVKRVIERKVSKLDKFGQVMWTMGEGIIYDCPKSGQPQRYDDNLAITNLPVRDNSANKRIRLIQKNENDQSEESEEV